MGDYGGVIVAVKYFKTKGPTNLLECSTDEGLTRQQHQFYDKLLRVDGLITEPGENTTVFTMFGSKQDSNTGLIDLIIVKVDLAAVFTKNCLLLAAGGLQALEPPGAECQVNHGGQRILPPVPVVTRTTIVIVTPATRGRGQESDLTVSRIPTSMTMLAMTRCPLSVPLKHSMSGCRETNVREVWPPVTSLRPQQPPDLYAHLPAKEDCQD